MDRIRSALFLDFDNIFGGLMELDRKAALALVEDPVAWLERLAQLSLPSGTRRDFLICRAYLNPSGRIYNRELGNENGLVYLQRYRPNLMRAGFEVIDCPALTTRQKNAADIRIVIDTLACLEASVRYDEFLIASSDADFTPLLQKLRANDRRTTILAAGEAAPAYHCVADCYVDSSGLVDLLVGFDDEPQKELVPHSQEPNGSMATQGRNQVEQAVSRFVSESPKASLLSDLGTHLRERFQEQIERSGWFGTGGLSGFVRSINGGPEYSIRGNHIWDASKHEEPVENQTTSALSGLPASIAQICRITDLPRLGAAQWKAAFDVLAHYAKTQEFNLTRCTASARDELAELERPVGRQAIGFIVRGALYGGVRLDSEPPPTAEEIREALITATMDRAEASGLSIGKSDKEELRQWMMGELETEEVVAE